MSKILDHVFKAVFVTALAFTANLCYGQYAVKQTLNNAVKTTETTEYYTYNRSADSYDALSVKTAMISKFGVKPVYQLNVIYTTSTFAKTVQKLKFESVSDSSVQITVALVPDGTAPIDNKKLTSNKYHVELTDSVKLFLAQHTLKSLIVLDTEGFAVTRLPVEAGFLSQQLVCLQTPVKHRTPVKKYHKKST